MSQIHRLSELEPGQRVLYGHRTAPLTVRDVEPIAAADDDRRFVHEATLDGPRMGAVTLRETSTGRILAFKGDEGPPAVVRDLRAYRPDE